MRTAIIDFETTGLSPAQGDRATEIAIVLMERDRIVDRFQSLMNAGVRIPPFIESYTGITNAMIASAPPAEVVMADAARFVGSTPMVAHNASFDRRFWAAEMAHAGCDGAHPFACTMLLSRRLYPHAASYRLGALASMHAIEFSSRAHRAMADAEVAAHLWTRIRRDMAQRFDIAHVPHELLVRLGAMPRGKLGDTVQRYRQGLTASTALT